MRKCKTFEDVLIVDHDLLPFFMYFELIGYITIGNFLIYMLFN